MPVPMHIETMPSFLFVLFNSWNKVTIILEPVIPTGWPSAIAPPLGFNFSRGTPSFSIVYVAYDAKASLISKISISFTSRPAFFKATGIANAGPIPITSGGTPAQA
jgi:hypothetical protein